MNQFFSLEWDGSPFVLFSTPHLIALAIVALINVGLVAFGARLAPRQRKAVRYTLATVLVVDELLWHIWNATTGQWTVQTMLPLHLCSVLVWLSAVMLVKKSYPVHEVAYLLGIPGALQALLTPDAGIYGFPHFRAFQVMVSHGTIITAAIYMTAVEGFRPTVQSIKNVLIRANLYAVVVFVINLLIGSNYLFIAHKPETASLLDVLPAWPWYLPILELLALVFVGLFYLPFAISDVRTKRLGAGGASAD